ncbi:uncharacterized protein [Lolium perenne]|uniref:uncharacterized protein n=1 Tax=Lolium perenne TaxID=4522 RepID=UPI0021F69894|nr:uncharacterized protein LOC127295978 [Lolium perenne]
MGDSGAGDATAAALPILTGRFWSLDSGEDDDADLASSPRSTSPGDFLRSPSERVLKLSSRYVKRLNNRIMQRRAALDLAVKLDLGSSCSSGFARPKLNGSPPATVLKFPVLEPTVFFLQDFNATEWTRVERKKVFRRACADRSDHRPGLERRRSPGRRDGLPLSRSRSRRFQNRGSTGQRAKHPVSSWITRNSPQFGPARRVNLQQGLPAPVPRCTPVFAASSRPLAARAAGKMASREPPPNSGAPRSNPPLRQHVLPGRTPVRPDGRGDGGFGGRVDGGAVAVGDLQNNGFLGHGDQQSRRPQRPVNSSGQGFSSSQSGNGAEHDEGFRGQGFDAYESGYFEGNNGYGNGYGSMDRGNYRQRPYRPFYAGNRARYNNYRGGNGRFNGYNNNRYQRVFNTAENFRTDATTQAQTKGDAYVASIREGGDASMSVQNMETSSVESLSARAQKKIDKRLCLRCGENGHLAESCTAILCLYCEKTSHDSINCPLHAMPKPVAITYGVSRNELMFHEIPASSEVTFRHDSGKVGKISVSGGVLSAQEIVKELEWIIPGNHQWDLVNTDDGAFKVTFPSKADMARMTKIINVPVPGTTMFLVFEEWSAADLDPFFLTQVWVRVQGCCYKERCDYLSLFGVGSLIGKTKEVDMAFTRTHSEARMLVEVTRAEFIPTTTIDHTYDGKGYGLIFKVEEQKGKGKLDVDMQEASPEDEPKESDGKDDDLPKQDKPPNSPPAPGQPKNPFVSNSSKPSTNSNNQTQAYSMPNLKVGSITCPSPVHSEVGFWSQGKKVAPRRLWGDCSSEDDDDLPSPLPRLISDVDVSVGEPLGVPTVTGKTEVFSATEQSAVAASIDDKTMEDTTEKFPGLVLDAHGLGGRGVVHPHLDASGKVIGASDSSVRACNKENLEPTLVSTMAQKGAHEDGLVGNTFSSPVMSPKYTSVMLNGGTNVNAAGTGVYLGGRYSREEIVAFGGISEKEMAI